MADITSTIEALENQWMRAWVGSSAKELKSLTARDFILLMGSKPAMILDSTSWLDAAAKRWRCTSYRFGDIHVREFGAVALFASQLEMKARMDGEDWSGTYWVADLWRKGRLRRRWQMVERSISRIDERKEAPAAIKSLQLWR